MDATYQADLRELNESNFARFDAKVGERLADLHSDIQVEIAQVRREMAQLETKLADRLGQVKSDLLKWMFTFWVSTLIGLGGLFFSR